MVAPPLQLPYCSVADLLSRLLLWNGKRDVQSLPAHPWLHSRNREIDIDLDDGVPQPPDTAHLDFDDIPGLDRTGIRWGTRQDHITWFECDQTTKVSNEILEREEQVVGNPCMLNNLTVAIRGERQLGKIDLMWLDEYRAERTIPVQTFDAEHRTPIGVPEIVQAPVVRNGQASDRSLSLVESHPSAPAADDQGNFPFVVQEATASRARNGCSVRRE